MEVDRLGALPEHLLLDIIRRLGCWKGAARTAVLSKQWRFLWTELPFPFVFRSDNIEENRRFAAGVHAALALRRGRALETLHVDFHYDRRLSSDIDSWLDFAAKNKVKSVCLNLYNDIYNFRPDKYNLPPAIYSNSWLTQLSLRNCTIASVTSPVEWRCLKSLSLERVDFEQQQAIGEILSGCPLLETLTLDMCSGFSRLKIGNRSFSSLLVMYCSDPNDDGSLEIWAPYMKYLHIYEIGFTSDGGRKVRFENVGSLESAGFEPILTDFDSATLEGIVATIEKFLHLGRGLKKLWMTESKALSMMATHGWRFAHLMKVEVLRLSGAKPCGVVAMLESCPLVQKLVLDGTEEESVKCGRITRDDLNCDLMHLKTVIFDDYFHSSISSEPTLTMARILLKRAPHLEKIVIWKTYSVWTTKVFDDLKNTLIQSPKSSHRVSIEIQSSYFYKVNVDFSLIQNQHFLIKNHNLWMNWLRLIGFSRQKSSFIDQFYH